MFLDYINHIKDSIKFTLEIEQDNSLNFLDLTVSKIDKKLKYKIYRKPTFTDAIIPMDSNQSFSIKMSTFHSMIHRLLSIPLEIIDYIAEVHTTKTIAANNGYNPLIIDKMIINKKKSIINKKIYCNTKMFDSTSVIYYLNYIPNLTHKLSKKLATYEIETIITNKCKLGKLLSNNKEKLQKLEQNGIYKINCCDCDAIYIGQCGRSFKQRIKEHIQSIEKQNFTTGFSEHCINQKHNFKGEFEILHIVDKGGRMNIFENLEIRKAVNSKKNIVNEQVDVNDSPLLNL